MLLLKRKSRGFTLIELVTAIGILAILLSVALVVINPLEQFQKSRDARRKADLNQLSKAFEIYYQDYGRYPRMTPDDDRISTDGTNAGAVDWGSNWSPYMDVLPGDSSASKNYAYWVDEGSGGQAYALYASLDRGGRDPDACKTDGTACENADGRNVVCGDVCNYGVTSSNIAP